MKLNCNISSNLRIKWNILSLHNFQASVSIKRLGKFLNLEELDPDNVQHDFSIGTFGCPDCEVLWNLLKKNPNKI